MNGELGGVEFLGGVELGCYKIEFGLGDTGFNGCYDGLRPFGHRRMA